MKKTIVLLTCLVSLTACGGGSRPTADELTKSMKDNISKIMPAGADKGMTDKLIECMSKGAVDSKMSNGSLNAMKDGDDKIAEDDAKIFGEVTQKCVSEAMATTTP